LLGFLLGRVVVAVEFAGRFLGRGLDFFSFNGSGHLSFSLILSSSPTFKGGACS